MKRPLREVMGYLGCVGSQHGPQGERNFVDCECRRPAAIAPVVQDIQADVAIAVDMGMHRTGRNKEHLHQEPSPCQALEAAF